ncbi:unnamed protein product [Moneuplotes crassus]|uniref:Uncharacterized protein n=1 Tax=Euplotes crassus TaxID=5936 RepID=A0AAD1XBS4_EUPCR|nr:unnamed protein product [Moneuplotes crassus]
MIILSSKNYKIFKEEEIGRNLSRIEGFLSLSLSELRRILYLVWSFLNQEEDLLIPSALRANILTCGHQRREEFLRMRVLQLICMILLPKSVKVKVLFQNNSQNSQPSSRKKKTINDLTSQQRKLLELAREKYSRFTRKCNKQKKTKFRRKSKFQKQFKEFDKMSAIRYPTLNNTKMNNGFHNNIPQFRRCTKEEHASFLCDLPKLDISTTPIELKSKSRVGL